jgi:hypothetical protein
MNERFLFKIRIYFTAIVTFSIWTLLAWSHYHGGVQSHHLLANKDLPAISNWWGGLIIPILTWFLLYRIQKRISNQQNGGLTILKYSRHILYRFIGSFLFGILLSIFFTFEYSDMAGFMVLGLLPISLFFPIYRAECLLGFVFGMTYTFGTVLPTCIGSIFVSVCAVVYLLIRPRILYLKSKFIGVGSSHK